MKSLHWLLTLLLILSTSTLAQAEPSDTEERGSWLERLFGSKKSTEKAQPEADEEASEPAEKKSEESKAKQDKQFSKEERETLESWQKGNAKWKKKDKPLPPGLQKKVDRGGELPPGWQKKLEVGGKLDTELEEAAISLPEEILKRLPEAPENTEILQIGEEIVRVVENTREVVDILSNWGGEPDSD